MCMTESSFARLQNITFFGLLAVVTGLFFWLIHGFMMPIIWAVVLAALFRPFSNRLATLWRGQRSLAAAATMFLALCLVFIPITIVGTLLVRESTSLYTAVSTESVYTYFEQASKVPLVAHALETFNIGPADVYEQAAAVTSTLGGWITSQAYDFGARTISFIAKTFVMLYLLFFLLRDGKAIGGRIMRILPLGDANERFLFQRFAVTTRAIVKGSIIVAIVQGSLGAVIFWLAGIGNPITWGAIMSFAALIPAVGPGLVWVPAAILLFISGDIFHGVIVLLGGAVVIGTIDNILRPMLVGRDTNIPDAIVLLSVLGGIGVFGLSGLLLGPVIAAMFLAVWQLFEEQYRDELTTRG